MEYIGAAVAGVVGLVVGFFVDRIIKGGAYKTRDEILQQASRDADNLRKDREIALKEEMLKRREKLELKLEESRDALRKREREIDTREVQLKEQNNDFRKKEQMLQTTQQKLAERAKAMEARQTELNRLLKEEQEQLYKISELNHDEAKSLLLKRLETELSDEVGALIMKHESEVKTECDRQAREVIGMAVQRYASAHTSEIAVSTVDIPNDEMKGRIIGREGRNIRAFEKETGVDVIVDDTPGVVIISAFDTVRREIGKLSLVKLIQDGRIHPTRIEEIVAETQKEMDEHIRRLGLEACEEVGIRGLHEKIVYLMGRLHFRVSYSQNVRQHSVEVAHLTGLLAEQLGLDGTLARRCGFLHDIGKAADHEMEGGHPAVGAELLKRYGENEEVVHAAFGHHDDIRPEHIYTVLVAAADAISAARPGARRETLEKYVRRLEELEGLACGFPGVQQAFAVQAGREIRIIVDAEQINDRQAKKMTRDIATAIEQSLTYPGEIKVTVLRETRTIEYAK
ncbi:ribonuclease Y [Fuerstiella marisgermanici]|uniref:Ribonuclease Y n=1 Tax=Fuerstiella marisgermanici TaxID=1891926 RepID=A0A1P8WQ29_9PLAN|nr:ribonuclease Y [Fuerstiella marisgermanici]APZ96170.1 Ribonuclease Y [Fuerstiella marisgermanici]